MLTIIVPGVEIFDEASQEFVTLGDVSLGARAFSGLTVKMGVNLREAFPW